jgi:PAS domain S-box-containing protein
MPTRHWPSQLERSTQAMWLMDPARGTVLFANRAAAELCGYDRTELEGLPLERLRVDPAEPTALEHLVSSRRGNGNGTAHVGAAALARRDGSTVVLSVAASEVSYESHPALLCLLEDAARIRDLEDATRRAKERLDAVTRASRGWVWDLDVATRMVWRSDGFAPSGASLPESTYDAWIDRLHPDDRERIRRVLDTAVAERRPTVEGEYRYRQADGSYLDILDRAAILYDDTGSPIRMIGAALDISDRRRAERERDDSELRLRLLFESSIVGVVFGRLDGTVTEANDEYLRITGYARDDIASGRLNWKSITAPEYESVNAQAVAEYERTGRPMAYEKEYIRKDGSRIPVLVGASFFEHDRERGFGVVVDLTSRRRAEAAVRESEARLRSIVHSSMVGMGIWRTGGQILEANDRLLRLLGVTREEFEQSGLNMTAMTAPEDIARGVAHRALVRPDGSFPPIEIAYIRRDGTRVAALVGACLFPDRQDEGAFCVLDLTERRQAQAERQQHERWVQAIFEGSRDAILLFDDENRYLDANPAACRLYGYTHEELCARSAFDLTPPEDHEFLRRQLRILAAQGWTEAEHRRVARDGRIIHLQARAVANIMPGVHMSILRDLTERRQTEAELRNLSGRLLRLQDEERRRVARELHDSTAQSLAAIALGLSVVAESPERLDARGRKALADTRALLEEATREVRSMSYLLHPPLLDEMGLSSALRNYVDGWARRSGVATRLEISPSLPRLPGEAETALFRIVQECLTNIQRHSGSATAEVRLMADAESVVLEVADRGHGSERLATLPGNEANPTLGVGVAGMKERVRQLGGRLMIESGGTGTTVRVVLPGLDA